MNAATIKKVYCVDLYEFVLMIFFHKDTLSHIYELLFKDKLSITLFYNIQFISKYINNI